MLAKLVTVKMGEGWLKTYNVDKLSPITHIGCRPILNKFLENSPINPGPQDSLIETEFSTSSMGLGSTQERSLRQ